VNFEHFNKYNPSLQIRVVKRIIPDQIFYLHLHFLPIFCSNLRKKEIENPRKSHPFYNPDCYSLTWYERNTSIEVTLIKYLMIKLWFLIMKNSPSVFLKKFYKNSIKYRLLVNFWKGIASWIKRQAQDMRASFFLFFFFFFWVFAYL
jgi:hypothetical protein